VKAGAPGEMRLGGLGQHFVLEAAPIDLGRASVLGSCRRAASGWWVPVVGVDGGSLLSPDYGQKDEDREEAESPPRKDLSVPGGATATTAAALHPAHVHAPCSIHHGWVLR